MRVDLRYKFVSIVLLAAIPFFVYAVFSYLETLSENKQAAVARNLAKAAEMAQEVDDFIDMSQNVLYSLALQPAIVQRNSAACDELFRQLLPLYPLHLNLLAADMQGRNFASGIEPAKAHRLSYTDKDWFVRGSKGISVVTDVHRSKLFSQPAFMITMPVFDDNGIQTAILGFPVNLFKLQEHFQDTELNVPHINVSLIDNKGITLLNLAEPQTIGMPFAAKDLLQKISGSQTGSLVAVDQHHVKRFYSYASVTATGWKVLVEIPASDVYAAANRDAVRHLLFFVFISFTGGVTALFFSRQLMAKMQLIINGLNEVAAGNFAYRLNIPGHDEIARAGEAFNRMTAERARAEEKIMNFAATLEKQVEVRTAELLNTKNELEAFTYAVSHDLQAPVRHIISFTQILREDAGSELSPKNWECLQRIDRAGAHMRDLIAHLLDLSRIGRQEMSRRETDLSAICRSIFQELAADNPTRQIDVEIADGLIATCDASLVTIALTNLLGNAWKYTSKTSNPRIEVGKTVHNGVACFFVRDNGSGFDMAFAHRLFTPFQRLHAAEDFEGTGVGLATVMRIIQRHEGAIWAESSPGHGSVFYFTLAPSPLPQEGRPS